jgi:hypothetical protein
MPVTVDQAPLETEQLGLRTVGQVLSHLVKGNRLVVYVSIDGKEPDLNQMPQLRGSAIADHTIKIETAEPRQMALEILQQVEAQLDEAEKFKTDAADLLQKNQTGKAMEKLTGCFTAWQNAQQSIVGTAQLMKLDLEQIQLENGKLTELLHQVTGQLQSIKSALENRDFVTLSDLLIYETTQTNDQWMTALSAVRRMIK